MGWTKIKIALVVTGAALVITIVSIIVTTTGNSASRYPSKSVPKFRLPRGQIVPAIRLGTAHGVILASDGSIWSWGENADGWPVLGLGKVTNQTSLHRIGNETDWISIAVGSHHNLALKSDGTVGTNVDWRAISAFGWFYQLLLKKDGALWSLWAETGSSPKPLRVTRVNLTNDIVAFDSVGRGHPVGVVLTRDGEVWTWGRVLAEHTPAYPSLQAIAKLAQRLHLGVDWGNSRPVTRQDPWQINKLDPEPPTTK